MDTIERLESQVRAYVRSFPKVFTEAKGNRLTATDGTRYLDFFSGAGALNYGHNDAAMKRALLDYIQRDGINHGLDMATEAKETFLATFEAVILKPRGMDYKLQFPGPTGTNAVEAALKLARKVKGRSRIVHFTHGFHGMTLGSMAVTANAAVRGSAGVGLDDAVLMPYSHYYADGRDTAKDFEALLTDDFSGVDKPAAVIVETVQGEGGINVADVAWLREIERLCRAHDMLLIVDDIQAGIGRTGPFFSFEPAGISPDIVTVAKSLSGMGLPLAMALLKPELDVWEPGEHTGTFRGNNQAFVTGTAALETYWRDDALEQETLRKGEYVRERLATIMAEHRHFEAEVRGRGLFIGLACERAEFGNAIIDKCFERGLIMETTGQEDCVVKVMPPLISTDADLDEGLAIIEDAIEAVLDKHGLLTRP
ncbi:diaminobutyrate--2-oxoglutarate transaminase [Modicisalibacter tunisiensis]|uniref:Diaminobutyrate--2-oxoglutarate transaminase n=1 Tax=Modicisalibacter tunisiensis TaxID=390637 RepID=A0ABS7WYN4_9GAMM|nr:diaminobutyrate--2-oxoglutarate transaminase [Modicisalibacter tunisiensis]MBZ9567249.1 diaminobutyrate--2-oxoglutarate transaminase [Modicisalibacter tunisiensis]